MTRILIYFLKTPLFSAKKLHICLNGATIKKDMSKYTYYPKEERDMGSMMGIEKPNVLIVDDEQQVLDTMSMYLEEIAHVHTVINGKQAIEYVQRHKIDVILLDIEMPLMDGFATLEQLRKMEDCINVPVILVTGMCDRYTVFNSVAMGIDGYLVKPAKKEDVQKKVLETFEKYSQYEEKKTILLIDDDMTYLKQLNNLIQDEYNVILINSAKLALEYLLKHIPDVIVMDYNMPLYNGASMMNMIQNSSAGRNDIPIIILSGSLNREALQECYLYNPVACLAKPVTKEVLMETIEQALER